MKRILQLKIWREMWSIVGAASIRVKVLGIVLGMILLVGLFLTLQIRSVLTDTLTRQLEEQGSAIADQIAAQSSDLLDDQEALQGYLDETQVHYSGENHNTLVEYILVADDQGQIIAHTFDKAIPQNILENLYFTKEHHYHVVSLQNERGTTVEFLLPMLDESAFLRLGLADDKVQRTVNSITRQILYTTLLMMAVGALAAALLTWILTRPLLSLVQATQAVANGDFSQRVPRWANDEIGELAEAFNNMTAALAKADDERSEREQLRARYISGVIEAQEDERKRLARELHDSTSQSLTSLLLGLRNLEDNPAELEQHAEDMRRIVNDTLEEVHLLAWQLRPSALDDLGLEAALQRQMDEYQQRYGLRIDFVWHGLTDARLPPEMETAIYRITQEALTNIARHAKATHASILLEQRNQAIRIIIEDNGVGFDPHQQNSKHRLGLQGIRERARLFGGSLTIETVPEQGTSLFVELPIPLNTEAAHVDAVLVEVYR